ncbi:hypothetical protein EBESD8_57760 [Rhodococcus aetherivorans]|nr:hypothetical protein EBESD8_57760 [Rhodococcus aetherivorans]
MSRRPHVDAHILRFGSVARARTSKHSHCARRPRRDRTGR